MKTIKRTIALLNVFLFCLPFSFSQWTVVNPSASGPFRSIYFFDSMNGIATGFLGTIRTTNGGNTWSLTPVFGLYDVDFASSTIGYAAGVSGSSLQKTTNGGISWSSLTPLNINSLWGVSVVDASTLFVCGTGGVVWKSTNGGTSFSACDLPVPFSIGTDLQFLSATTGCVVTDYGQIYRTTDAGTSWTVAFDGTGLFDFSDIYFADANNGYAVGTDGRIYKSTDAGVSWASQTSGTTYDLEGVHFYDVNMGIACGEAGTVLRTTNGGLTWIAVSTGTTERLYSCWMTSPNTAIADGGDDMLIKTSNLSAMEDELDRSNISIFPNPSIGIVNITSEKEINSIRIFNPLGELVYTTVSPFYKIMIEIPHKIAGIYMIEFEIDGKKYVKKLSCN